MKNMADSTRAFIHEWSLNILILLFGTTTLVQAFIVPTPSMDTTVMVGDHLLVDKLSYSPAGAIGKHLLPYTEPKRGDVIVFRYPMDIRQNYVKRVMGVPGDHIRIRDKVVSVNGKALTEPYAQPPGNYFAMGDNRDNSLDSRYWGFVPRENIIGKPLVIFWSYDAPTEEWVGNAGSHYVDLAKNFFFKTRWNRTLKLVRGIPIE